MDVSIIVVSYNTRELTLDCLSSVIRETRRHRFEIAVVDNLSTDGSRAAIRNTFPDVHLIEPPKNLGFAKANNLAATQLSGRYLLLLNPDTVVLNGAIDRLVEFAETCSDSAIIGGRTVYPDGSLNRSSCWGRPSLWSAFCLGTGISVFGNYADCFDPETMRRWQRDSVKQVDIISGCFLLIKRDLWNLLGGFDPSFDMYGEDFDLCLRAREAGAVCLVYPDAEIIHYGSASEAVKADQLVRQMRARIQLMRKHWAPTTAALGELLLRLRVFSRAHTGLLPSRCDSLQKSTAHAWKEAWCRRKEWLRR